MSRTATSPTEFFVNNAIVSELTDDLIVLVIPLLHEN